MKASLWATALMCAMAALPLQAAAPEPAAPARDAAERVQLSGAMADLGLAFLRDAPDGQNSLNSPYSATNAMGLVLLGAAGNSERELASLLQGGNTDSGLLARHMAEINPLLMASSGEPTLLRNANRMWLNAALLRAVRPEYAQQVRQTYQSDAQLLSFAKPARAASTINAWAKDQTGGKITQLLSGQDLPSATQMVLTNGVYFKGQWRTRFDAKNTHDDWFTLADQSRIRVPTMHARLDARTAQVDGAQWLELPYASAAREPQWVMQIALPEPGQSLAQWQQGMTGAKWQSAMAQLVPDTVAVALPRFAMHGKAHSLRSSFQKLGVREVFSDKADLSRINGDHNLLVDNVFQQASIDVDETGTVATAATAAVVSTKSLRMPQSIVLDRPFLFLIVHRPSQIPVFVGRVLHPAQ